MKKVTAREMLDFYDYTLRKTVNNKDKLIKFEMKKSEYIEYIVGILNNEREFSHYYNIFLIFEPKPRLIMSLNMIDKIVNHYFTNKYLIPKLDRKLDDRNVATRIGKGTDYALKLVKKYIEYYKRNNLNCYVLKIDISKFFYTIDHKVLKNMLKEDLNYDEYMFCNKIIDSTNYNYINDKIQRILDAFGLELPFYEYGKGLPIGNLSSQCLSVYYLNRLDHYIIHDLHLIHYVRYMDDFLILCDDKEYLTKCMNIILDKLVNDYKLKINKKKTSITNMKYGFSFLGYRFFVKNKKTIMIVKRNSINSLKKKIKKNINSFNNNKISLEKYFSSMTNYYFSFRSNRIKIKNIIEHYM